MVPDMLTDQELSNLTTNKICLLGLTGSKAYGLDTPQSDEDFRGVFITPTEDILGIYPYKETIDRVAPDVCVHELGKFFRLALAGNPNILELMYLDKYELLSEEGEMIVSARDSFLSNQVKVTYAGYAFSQLKRLKNRDGESYKSKLRKRKEKHTRHLFRLLIQCEDLIRTGHLTVRLTNPEYYFEVGNKDVDEIEKLFNEQLEKIDNTPSILPDKPDYDTVNSLLLEIRKMN